MQATKWYRFLPVLLGVFLIIGTIGLLVPTVAFAVGDDLTISGPGLKNPGPIIITQNQLRGTEALPAELQTVAEAVYLPQTDAWYSTINTWPTKSWYRGQGVKLTDLLNLAGGLNDEATLIRFTSRDGFKATFTVQELLVEPRYRFPSFMDTGLPGHLPGDPSEPVEVEPIIAHRSFTAHDIRNVVGEGTLENFSDGEANHLLYGQRAVTQQTNARFVKYVTEIEVLTDPVSKWDNPTADPAPGDAEVPVGTLVELQSPFNDEDKVHYTLDGSDPTINSPMYNWIASRWWSSRSDVLDEINHPIEITDNTTIKAFVTGPGRADSDIVTFAYRVPLTINQANPAKAIKNEEYAGHTFTAVGGQKPYRFAVTGGSLPEGMSLNESLLEGIPAESGTFPFTLTVTDGNNQTVSREFTLVVVLAPPTLSTTSSNVGQKIELTFTDDAVWREAITDVTVNGNSITGHYSVAAGVITIDAAVFATAGDYTIAVIATGYLEAVVIQNITAGTGPKLPDGEIVLTIKGDGVANPKEFTQSQLEEMNQCQYVYSCINTWPSKRWYVGKGVELNDLLNQAGGIQPGATLIKFTSKDGYYMTFTVQELLRDKRYRFPNFKTGGGDGDGHIPGSAAGAVEVKPILALISAEGTDNPAYMNEADAPLLMLGQRSVTEQTGPLFAKYVKEIEVLTNSVPKWDSPKAEPGSGSVPAGTLVTLSNNNMDMDKIHYTTDGSNPTLHSPIYNWIAKRWWASRGEDTVAQINHPIKITKDTTIKAITIGPGRENSDIVTFTYKVTGPLVSTSDQIRPSEGGTVSLGDEAVLEIPAGALTGTNPIEVKIDRVTEPPAAPTGFKIIGSVYEFNVDGKTSYIFNKPVTLKLSFDPERVGSDAAPAIHYYDETEKKWVNLGGEVNGNTISVQVEHFTKFAVLAAFPAKVTTTIEPSKGGTVSIGEEAVLEIPAGALTGTSPVEVTIKCLTEPPVIPVGYKLVGGVYEFSVDEKTSYRFNKAVTLKLSYDPELVSPEETPAIHYYDETQKKWINLSGEAAGHTVTVELDHFTIFTVMVAPKAKEVTLTDIAGHWAENQIKELVGLGAISGYPDGTFKPDNNITRAEFATILVKAFKLEPQSGQVFADTAGHWAKDTIATAAAYGIVNGYDGHTFGPNDLITREQMAAMIVNALKLKPVTEESSFIDSGSISGWARVAVSTAVKNGLINGYPDNTIRPQGQATRAEAAAIMVNALLKLQEENQVSI
jgi:hypothetical protein